MVLDDKPVHVLVEGYSLTGGILLSHFEDTGLHEQLRVCALSLWYDPDGKARPDVMLFRVRCVLFGQYVHGWVLVVYGVLKRSCEVFLVGHGVAAPFVSSSRNAL